MNTQVEVTVETLAQDRFADLVKLRKRSKRATERAISVSYKDLLVVTRFAARSFGPAASAVNTALDGLLESAIADSSFSGRQGETLMVELESQGVGSGNARRALIVGLGHYGSCQRFQMCALIGCVIDEATNASSEHVILPLVDLVSTPDEARMCSSIIRCRVNQHLVSRVEHGRLKRIRLIVDGSMKTAAEAGLLLEEPLCKICSEPQL